MFCIDTPQCLNLLCIWLCLSDHVLYIDMHACLFVLMLLYVLYWYASISVYVLYWYASRSMFCIDMLLCLCSVLICFSVYVLYWYASVCDTNVFSVNTCAIPMCSVRTPMHLFWGNTGAVQYQWVQREHLCNTNVFSANTNAPVLGDQCTCFGATLVQCNTNEFSEHLCNTNVFSANTNTPVLGDHWCSAIPMCSVRTPVRYQCVQCEHQCTCFGATLVQLCDTNGFSVNTCAIPMSSVWTPVRYQCVQCGHQCTCLGATLVQCDTNEFSANTCVIPMCSVRTPMHLCWVITGAVRYQCVQCEHLCNTNVFSTNTNAPVLGQHWCSAIPISLVRTPVWYQCVQCEHLCDTNCSVRTPHHCALWFAQCELCWFSKRYPRGFQVDFGPRSVSFGKLHSIQCSRLGSGFTAVVPLFYNPLF